MRILDQLYAFVGERRTPAFLVGGTVRDSLLGRDRYDIDVTVPGDAIAMARAFADRVDGAFYVMDEEFGVARVISQFDGARQIVDFSHLRGNSIEEDLATRDFAINAMAAEISSGAWQEDELIDPFNGRDDLEARRIRAISSQVFDNDPVRLMRAVRFEATLGFGLDPRTETVVRREARKLVDAPPERLREEFFKILGADNSYRHLRRLDNLGLLQFLLPEITLLKGVSQSDPHRYDVFTHTLHTLEALEALQHGDYLDLAQGAFASQLSFHFSEMIGAEHQRGVLLRLATLLHDVGKPASRALDPGGRIVFAKHENLGADMAEKALKRLRFSNDEVDLLTTVIAGHMLPLELAFTSATSDLAIYRYFRATGSAGVDIAVHAWCDLHARSAQAQTLETDATLQSAIARLLDRYYHARDTVVDPPPFLNGRDVIATLEIPQGPLVGKYLEATREAQVTGQVSNREQALDFIRHWQPNGGEPDF